MLLGFIKPDFPNEKRVALLPEHIAQYENKLVIEAGFGEYLDIDDEEYIRKNCMIKSRHEIFSECDSIFSLKLIQQSDYDKLRKGQMIIGWTHPTGSGMDFMDDQATPKEMIIVDLDNINPKIYFKGRTYKIPFIQSNFIWRNSFNAGYSSTFHAILSMGYLPNSNTKVAILSSGNAAQGAYKAISKFDCDVRLFYRKTMPLFYNTIAEYDIIINGIEIDTDHAHIISKQDLKKIQQGCLIIDVAADAGRAIEGTKYTTIEDPIYYEGGKYFYEVNNSPSILYRDSSRYISNVLKEVVFEKDIKRFWDLIS